MRFLKRKGNGKPKLTVFVEKVERKPWVIERAIRMRPPERGEEEHDDRI